MGSGAWRATMGEEARAVTYPQVPESPLHRLREEFRERMGDRANANACLKVADEALALVATLEPEEARRFIKLMRDLLDTVEPKIERGK